MFDLFKSIVDVSPPMKGPDRSPTVREFHHAPNVQVYDPNDVKFHSFIMPTQPNGPGGPQNYNADCVKHDPVVWDRSGDACVTREFFRRMMSNTGLEHV